MNTFVISRHLSINGGCAGMSPIDILAKNKIVTQWKSGNVWSSSEYSANNAWNVNFNNGNSNGNNKYNSYSVRPSAALTQEMKSAIIEALYDCCRNKRSSSQCIDYLISLEKDIFKLGREIYSMTYKPGISLCFGVRHPKPREIFAACFRDRIAQHWITIRLEPLFEQLFYECGDVSYNCRKGFGTQRAVKKLESDIKDVSLNYTREAFIGHYDIQAFFNSVDKYVLWESLCEFINQRYHNDDKEVLLYMTKTIVMHRPCENCIELGDISILDLLPKNKRMKYRNHFVSMAIGNITSQLFANFLLSILDMVVMKEIERINNESTKLGLGISASYIRFADDIAIVTNKKSDNMFLRDVIGTTLQERCHLSIHPSKIYLQECRHGVQFCGYFIKPNRVYLLNNTFNSLMKRLIKIERTSSILIRSPSHELKRELEHLVAGANSILGFTKITNSYSKRRTMLSRLGCFWKVCYVTNHFSIIKIHKNYQL